MRGSPGRVLLAFLATLAITFIVPLPVYGLFSTMGWVEMPQEGSAAAFMLAVLVQKSGVAVGFVLLFRPAVATLGTWWPYALVWWTMYAIVEVGQALGPHYSMAEAVAGIVAEALYFPLSALAVARLLRPAHSG